MSMPTYETCPCGEEMMVHGGGDHGYFGVGPHMCGHCAQWQRGWHRVPSTQRLARKLRIAVWRMKRRLGRTD